MKKCLFILLVLISLTITGCSKDGLSGEKPPEVNINIGNESYENKARYLLLEWMELC